MSRTVTLDDAHATGVPVTIRRRALGVDTDDLDGVVLATGTWTLVGSLADRAHADGYEAVRTQDVTRVRRVREPTVRRACGDGAGHLAAPAPCP